MSAVPVSFQSHLSLVQASEPFIYVYIDVETRSKCDLKKKGAWNYAEHESTSLLCLSYAVADEKPVTIEYDYWQTECTPNQHSQECLDTGITCDLPAEEDEKVKRLRELAADPRVVFVAHNSVFEQAIWLSILVGRFNFPRIPITRWKCTMAKAYSHGLPGSLENAAIALQLGAQKDMEGNRVMLSLSKPRAKEGYPWWTPKEAPEKFQILYRYCEGDILVSRQIDKALPDLSPKELKLWQIDQRMNNKGVRFDLESIRKAISLIDTHTQRAKNSFWYATDLESPQQRGSFMAWLNSFGLEVNSTKEAVINSLLERPDLPEEVRFVLQISRSITKSSLAKYPEILNRANNDGWVRENLAYHGTHTGRWAGRGVQIQNLPRPYYDGGSVVLAIHSCDYDSFLWLYEDVSLALSSALRSMIIPEDEHELFVADLAQMEARVLAWLAGQQDVLDLFARGEDLYCYAASNIFGYKVMPDMKMQRQVGKVAVLALGYGGGIAAFVKFAEIYYVDLMVVYDRLFESSTVKERELAEKAYKNYAAKHHGKEKLATKEVAFVADLIKQRWRLGNQKIQEYWDVLENAAIEAVSTGKPVQAGKCLFFMHGKFLYCKLPSGRLLTYPYPAIAKKGHKALELRYFSVKHGREGTYGGKIAENVTQAVQRDLLVDAMLRLENAGYEIIFHVHDEIICQVKKGSRVLQEFIDLIKFVPQWATGIPINASGWAGFRYGKE